jgi:hypothetical protein
MARVVGHHVESGAVTCIQANWAPVEGNARDVCPSLDFRA